jgi:hypothetical protein
LAEYVFEHGRSFQLSAISYQLSANGWQDEFMERSMQLQNQELLESSSYQAELSG